VLAVPRANHRGPSEHRQPVPGPLPAQQRFRLGSGHGAGAGRGAGRRRRDLGAHGLLPL